MSSNTQQQPKNKTSNGKVPVSGFVPKKPTNAKPKGNAPVDAFVKPKAPFKGVHATRINENYCFGSEGQIRLRDHFSYLNKDSDSKKFCLSLSEPHPHAYAAFWRKHFDRSIVLGLAAKSTLIDVGGHAIRTTVSERDDKKWTESVHSMLPIVDANDKLRHKQWDAKLRAMDCPYPIPNSCNHRASADGLCDCLDKSGKKLVSYADFKSIDSAYYPGVIEGIDVEQQRNPKAIAYYAFHDYAKAIRNGVMEYKTVDEEAKVSFELVNGNWLVKSQVKGNPFAYRHPVINTGKQDTWCRKVPGGCIVYDVQNRISMGEHDYVLVVATFIDEVMDIEAITGYFMTGEVKPTGVYSWTSQHLPSWETISKSVSDNMRELMQRLWTLAKSLGEQDKVEVSVQGKYVTTVISRHTTDGIKTEAFTVNPEDVSKAYTELIGRTDSQSMERVCRKLCFANAGKSVEENAHVLQAVRLAAHLVSKDMVPVYHTVHRDEAVLEARNARLGTFVQRSLYQKACRYLQIQFAQATVGEAIKIAKFPVIILTLMAVLRIVGRFTSLDEEAVVEAITVVSGKVGYDFGLIIVTLIGWFILYKQGRTGETVRIISDKLKAYGIYIAITVGLALLIGARADDGAIQTTAVFKWWYIVPIITLMFVLKWQFVTPKSQRRWIVGSCVRDKSRLDMAKNRGRVDPKIRFVDYSWNITGMTGEEAANHLGCDKGGIIEAGQIGPLIRGTVDYQPTVIHACKQTKMSAALRACSNKLYPSDKMLRQWDTYFTNHIEKKIMQYIADDGGLVVDLDEWMNKYPEAYRNNILDALARPDLFEVKRYTYDSFPKKELQFTTVCAELRDDPTNTVKERQISGPSIDKKIAANAFVYSLEGVAHRHMPEYCGRKDWPSICKAIDEGVSRLGCDIEFGFADGSGFDMTQVKPFQQRLTKMVTKVLQEGDCTIDVRLQCDCVIIKAFEDSESLIVNVDRGAVVYHAEGRASGDGWTTYGNTVFMISYWKFIFHSLNIPEHDFFLLVKGDDVLFAVKRKHVKLIQAELMKYMHNANELIEHGLGQIVKFVKWGQLEDGDFLSNMFFTKNDGTSRMVRIPARVFQTMPWSTNLLPETRNHDLVSRELTYSKGMCLLAWGKGLPIFEVLARKLISLGVEGHRTDYNPYADADRVWQDDSNDYEACASWMFERFGVSRQDIREIELAINGIKDLTEEVIIPQLDNFITEL